MWKEMERWQKAVAVGVVVVIVAVVVFLVVFFGAVIRLYHYTDNDSAQRIEDDGKILQSEANFDDASFGDGVYLTALGPSNSKEKLAKNNYGRRYQSKIDAGKLDSYIKVFLWRTDSKYNKTESKRDIYLYKGDLILKDMISYSISTSSGCFASSGRLVIVLAIAQVIGITAKFLMVN